MSLDFSPDGQLLASGAWDGMFRVQNLHTGEEIHRTGHKGTIRAVAFCSDGSRIVTGSFDRTAKVWEAATAEQTVYGSEGE